MRLSLAFLTGLLLAGCIESAAEPDTPPDAAPDLAVASDVPVVDAAGPVPDAAPADARVEPDAAPPLECVAGWIDAPLVFSESATARGARFEAALRLARRRLDRGDAPGPRFPQVPLADFARRAVGSDEVHDVDLDAEPPVYAGLTGRGVRVAVMDTGLDFDHPDFDHASFDHTDFGHNEFHHMVYFDAPTIGV